MNKAENEQKPSSANLNGGVAAVPDKSPPPPEYEPPTTAAERAKEKAAFAANPFSNPYKKSLGQDGQFAKKNPKIDQKTKM
jgi:hypothetical protein